MNKLLQSSLLVIILLQGVKIVASLENYYNKESIALVNRLFKAIKSQDVAEVQACCEQGVNGNWCCNQGKVPFLIKAVRQGNPKIVELLLKQGADINSSTIILGSIDCIDCPALIEAVMLPGKSEEERASRNAIVQLFLDRGVDIEVQDKDGKTALMQSVCNGEDTMVEFLINQGADKDIEGAMYIKTANTPHKYAHWLKGRYEDDVKYALKYQKNLNRVSEINERLEKINRIISLFDAKNNIK